MNPESSRSHLIFTIFLNLSTQVEGGLVKTRNSRLHLIDLAGSERQKSTGTIGERLKEAGMINK
jgi:kinesin family protein 15